MWCARFSALVVSESLGPSGQRFYDKVPKWHARYPPRFFDFKAFRKSLKTKKESLRDVELREIRREYAPPPPQGWTVLEFLKRIGFGPDAEDIANLFERWEDFISMTRRDIRRITDLDGGQRHKLDKFITLYNHGLWPVLSTEDYHKRFQGNRLDREGEEWTKDEDQQLLQLADLYDVDFGDPWIYLSWELQRRDDDVRQRYIELVVKPKNRNSPCEFAITKASRPLLMNRKFRMMPPDLYIVPSCENYSTEPKVFRLPAAFAKHRQNDIF